MASKGRIMDRVGMIVQSIAAVGNMVIALNAERKILSISDKARNLIDQGNHFFIRGGRIHAVDRDSDTRLLSMLARIHAREVNRSAFGVRPRDRSGAPPLIATVSHVAVQDRDAINREFALLSIALGEPQAERIDALAEAFMLTQAEASIAFAVADGMSIDAMAEARKVSRETIRSQLKSLMMKTGTRRQPELTALLSGILR
jgi:DNA-binding CsgD family transcriptional regulator